mmetsp:Transcript_79449/g.219761  ORF Transcript_79449/g.219761 Transcript_79449/m.219761 type:complete len:256 (-) Transcript_79449:560-1327(-)
MSWRPPPCCRWRPSWTHSMAACHRPAYACWTLLQRLEARQQRSPLGWPRPAAASWPTNPTPTAQRPLWTTCFARAACLGLPSHSWMPDIAASGGPRSLTPYSWMHRAQASPSHAAASSSLTGGTRLGITSTTWPTFSASSRPLPSAHCDPAASLFTALVHSTPQRMRAWQPASRRNSAAPSRSCAWMSFPARKAWPRRKVTSVAGRRIATPRVSSWRASARCIPLLARRPTLVETLQSEGAKAKQVETPAWVAGR